MRRVAKEALPRAARAPLRGLSARISVLVGLMGFVGFIGFSQPAQARPISVGEYRDRLEQIRAGIAAGEWQTPGLAARDLLATDGIAGPGGERVAPDASLLGPISRAGNLAEARGPAGEHLRRLGHLVRALEARETERGPSASSAGGAADRQRLARLAAREKLAALPTGGALPEPKVPESALDTLSDFFEPLSRILRAIGRKILELLDRMFRARENPKAQTGFPNWVIAGAVAVALALAGAAILYVRRRRRGGDVKEPGEAPRPPAADDDPLSREVGEWERYARELERAGRYREAVRAWYHAVLVALYRTGYVHYRRGRTNWEYVSSLSPSLPARQGFSDLTRRFEREWYGREESDPEALATVEDVASALLRGVRSLGEEAA